MPAKKPAKKKPIVDPTQGLTYKAPFSEVIQVFSDHSGYAFDRIEKVEEDGEDSYIVFSGSGSIFDDLPDDPLPDEDDPL